MKIILERTGFEQTDFNLPSNVPKGVQSFKSRPSLTGRIETSFAWAVKQRGIVLLLRYSFLCNRIIRVDGPVAIFRTTFIQRKHAYAPFVRNNKNT